jgi:hypothetical protein
MPDYLGVPVEVDPDEIRRDSDEYMESAIPGFVAAPGSLTDHLQGGTARGAAYNGELLSAASIEVYLHSGWMVGISPIAASSATVDATITMGDDAGYTIAAGFLIQIEGVEASAAFTVQDETVIAPGDTTADVVLVAVEQGAHTSGLPGPATVAEATDLPITSIALDGVTTGGVDEESAIDFLDRLTAEKQLLTPRPILPEDFAVMARRIAGVARALALDGYDPGDDSIDNERMITVAVRDAAGAAVSSEIEDDVEALLEAERETNFVVHVIGPTATAIDVAVEFVVYPGSDPALVGPAVEAAIGAYLSPAAWGQPPNGDTDAWYQLDKVRFQEISTVVNNVQGVDHWTSLLVGARKSCTLTASTDVISSADHGYSNGDAVRFALSPSTTFYVRDAATDSFKVSATPGGSVFDITGDNTTTVVHLDIDDVPLPGAAPVAAPGTITAGAA